MVRLLHTITAAVVVATIAAAAAATATTGKDGNYVTKLTPETFDDFVNSEELVLVKFYAPWCKHCQRFATEFIKAAKDLHAKKPVVKLAEVDCMLHDTLCIRYGIKEYPSLKVFRKDGHGEAYDYVGGRNAYGIVQYMVAESYPVTRSVTDAGDLSASQGGSTVVLYESDPASVLAAAYAKTAEFLRGTGAFEHVSDPALIAASGAADGSVVAYNVFGVANMTLQYTRAEDPADEYTALKRWCTRVYTPLVQVYNHNVEAMYGVIGRPLLVAFGKNMDPLANPSGVKYLANRLRKVALEYYDKLSCVIMDVTHNDYNKCEFTYVRKYAVAIIDYANNLKYCLDDALTASALKPDDVRTFAGSYVNGTLAPFYKSQPPPEAYDDGDAVLPIVRSQVVDEFLADANEQTFFMEVYTPWCSLCEDLRPTWERLAEEYLPLGHRFVFAKIDATKNDLPKEYAVNGYPTLFWIPAGKGSKPEVYDSMKFDRENLVEFITKKLNETPDPATTKDEL